MKFRSLVLIPRNARTQDAWQLLTVIYHKRQYIGILSFILLLFILLYFLFLFPVVVSKNQTALSPYNPVEKQLLANKTKNNGLVFQITPKPKPKITITPSPTPLPTTAPVVYPTVTPAYYPSPTAYPTPPAPSYNFTPDKVNGSASMIYIFEHESGNDPKRWNTSGCVGLGQACPASKLLASCPTLDYSCEVSWFTNYAIARYGSWDAAYSYWIAHHNW